MLMLTEEEQEELKTIVLTEEELAELIEWAETDELVGSSEFGIREKVRELIASIEVKQNSEE